MLKPIVNKIPTQQRIIPDTEISQDKRIAPKKMPKLEFVIENDFFKASIAVLFSKKIIGKPMKEAI